MNDSLIPELPDFSEPLSILRACHDRMLAHCDILDKLTAHIQSNGVDDEARSAISKIIGYFNSSARHHHEDEEQDLFPILVRQSLKLADIVHRLKQDHQRLNELWNTVYKDLKKGTALADEPEFKAHCEAFSNAYREHIQVENKELLTLAQHILSQQQLEIIGRAMAKRRGVKY